MLVAESLDNTKARSHEAHHARFQDSPASPEFPHRLLIEVPTHFESETVGHNHPWSGPQQRGLARTLYSSCKGGDCIRLLRAL